MTECDRGPTSTIRIGCARVGRLLVGHNPPCGNSHLTRAADREMEEYFTDENVVALYRRAESLGVSSLVIRGDCRMVHWLRLYRDAGGAMSVVAQTASEMRDIFANIRRMADEGVEAIYHHGTQTDRFWGEGRIDDCLPYLDCMRRAGVAVGLGTHHPEVIEYAEARGWDVDFYMASLYNISRKARESAIVARTRGKTASRSRRRSPMAAEEYLPADRQRMQETIRATDKPVLAFKILAAGRLCATQEQVREAFLDAYRGIKPTDGVVVGLFPKHLDQVALDMAYAEEACAAAAGV